MSWDPTSAYKTTKPYAICARNKANHAAASTPRPHPTLNADVPVLPPHHVALSFPSSMEALEVGDPASDTAHMAYLWGGRPKGLQFLQPWFRGRSRGVRQRVQRWRMMAACYMVVEVFTLSMLLVGAGPRDGEIHHLHLLGARARPPRDHAGCLQLVFRTLVSFIH
jgi:hypothetical protein